MMMSKLADEKKAVAIFIYFFDIHNPFKVPVNELISIATGVIASDDINVDSTVDIGMKIVSGLDNKRLREISLKRKDEAKTFVTMRKSVKVGETVFQMSSDQISEKLLASVVLDEAPLLEIFSNELLRVAPSLIHDNVQMKKKQKQN